MEPLAVNVFEAGRLLALSPRTIRRHIRSGRIKAVRIGGRVLVPVEALMQMLTEAAGPKQAASGAKTVRGVTTMGSASGKSTRPALLRPGQ